MADKIIIRFNDFWYNVFKILKKKDKADSFTMDNNWQDYKLLKKKLPNYYYV